MQLRDILPELIFGGLVVATAAGLAVQQWRTWQRNREDFADDAGAALHSWRTLRRRLQVSVLLAAIGVMLPIGVWQPLFQKRLLLFLGFWLAVFLLICWVVLLALGDMLATAVHARMIDVELNRERRRLEDEIERLPARARRGFAERVMRPVQAASSPS